MFEAVMAVPNNFIPWPSKTADLDLELLVFALRNRSKVVDGQQVDVVQTCCPQLSQVALAGSQLPRLLGCTCPRCC